MMTMQSDNPSPTLDFVFRKLFGSEENKDLLMSLINSIVEPDFHLTDVEIKNPFNLADYLDAKETIVDIKAQDQAGLWYDLEMLPTCTQKWLFATFGARSRRCEHPGPKHLKSCSAVHLSFYCLKSVNVSFSWPITPF